MSKDRALPHVWLNTITSPPRIQSPLLIHTGHRHTGRFFTVVVYGSAFVIVTASCEPPSTLCSNMWIPYHFLQECSTGGVIFTFPVREVAVPNLHLLHPDLFVFMPKLLVFCVIRCPFLCVCYAEGGQFLA